MVDREVDIVVFGATGFTGKFVARNLATAATTEASSVTWGVAGRNERKLQGGKCGRCLSRLPAMWI